MMCARERTQSKRGGGGGRGHQTDWEPHDLLLTPPQLDLLKGAADPAASALTLAKLKAGFGSKFDNEVWPPAQVICYVDDATGCACGVVWSMCVCVCARE